MTRNHSIIQILILLIINSAASTATSINANVADNNTENVEAPANIIRGYRLAPFHPIGHQISVHANDQFCGGTILDDWHVLTAAHCVVMLSGKPAQVIYVGTNNTIYQHANTAKITHVEKVYVPRLPFKSCAEYQPRNDVAVLKLNQSLRLSTNPNINKVNLPEPLYDDVYNTYEECIGMIAGYGLSNIEMHIAYHNKVTINNVVYSDMVQVANVWILPQTECQKIWSPIKIKPTMMCGRIRSPGYRGVCKSDNGNGLIYRNTVIGVMSLSRGRCYEGQSDNERPAIYTRVTKYLPFIKNVLQNKDTEVAGVGVCVFSRQETFASHEYSLICMWSLVVTSIAVIAAIITVERN